MVNLMHFDVFLKASAAEDDFLLDGNYILNPNDPEYWYDSTPRNALTFAVMGVDGVHDAIKTSDGCVRDDSPVVFVDPMDSKDVLVRAPIVFRVPC